LCVAFLLLKQQRKSTERCNVVKTVKTEQSFVAAVKKSVSNIERKSSSPRQQLRVAVHVGRS